MQFTFTIRVGSPNSGQVGIGGREIAFFQGSGPDRETHPLHFAAMSHFLNTGAITGTVSVTATGE